MEGKTIIKWFRVPRDTERNKINGVSQHMTKRPRVASQAEINEESGTQPHGWGAGARLEESFKTSAQIV